MVQFFIPVIFSTFNVVKLTNNSGASQESSEEQEYLQMSIVAHAAAAGALTLGCSRSPEPAGAPQSRWGHRTSPARPREAVDRKSVV